MGQIERIRKIAGLLNSVGGEIRSRKKIQKMIYLLQKLGYDFDQDFKFHYYGVYSPSLAMDLNLADQWEIISESDEEGPSGLTYIIKEGEAFEYFAASYGLNKRFIDNGLIAKLSEKEPALLEVVSTIFYLKDLGYNEKELDEKLYGLKRHLKHLFSEAKSFESELRKFRVVS